MLGRALFGLLFLLSCLSGAPPASAQVPPTNQEIAGYLGLHLAAALGSIAEIELFIRKGENANSRDAFRRTPAHIAIFQRQHQALRALLAHGSDPNALEHQDYDIVTIAAVQNDLEGLRIAFAGRASARNITSPYRGTALIAAAHLGHAEVVKMLIAANAPLDHVNNLGWTALIEAVILGDGGKNHVETVRALVNAGASRDIADRNGVTPLAHAKARGYAEIAAIIVAGKK